MKTHTRPFRLLPFCAAALCALSLAACSSKEKSKKADAAEEPRAETRAAARGQSEADKRLRALLDEDLEAQARRDPIEASVRGDRRYDHLLPDPSPRAERAWRDDAITRLRALDAIDKNALSDENRLNAALLRHELTSRVDGSRFRPWQTPITQMHGAQQTLPQLPDRLLFTTRKHYEDYLARLEGVPAHIDTTIANMREGMLDGRTPPRITMGSVAAQARAHGGAKYGREPMTHAMYKPFLALETTDPLAERARLAITESVAPAFERLADFLESDYVPNCRVSIGALDSVDGLVWYDWTLTQHTTTSLSAQEIHDTGLREVSRIRAEMMGVIARSDFRDRNRLQGDALFRAFLDYLRTDSRFYFDSAEELLAAYRDIAKRMDGELPRLFKTLPRTPYGVREMPAFIAPSAPTAYYYPGSLKSGTAGWFVANTHALDQRPRYEMIPLTLHEACPGHHLQIALALEMEDVHEWRTLLGYTAYVEGWALYSERLGLEVGGPEDGPAPGSPHYRGMYHDPYDDFGRLTYEMWRAMRLVVDTGIHAMGWTREQAIEYMLSNSGLSRTNVEREVDRYIAWPGQACAYKLGELFIRALRERAERELGENFDVRDFHHEVLKRGALPLRTLEEEVGRWIEKQTPAEDEGRAKRRTR